MKYVDGYVLPVPKKNLQAYRRMAQKAGKVWREHGALEYRECMIFALVVRWPSRTRMQLASNVHLVEGRRRT